MLYWCMCDGIIDEKPTISWSVKILWASLRTVEIGAMADRSSFWQMVDRTRPNKLRVFGDGDLGDCLDYFSEIQADSTLPPNESLTASERLTLIRSELDLRHADARHRRTQRLATWAIAVGMISIVVAVISAIIQYFTHKPISERQSTAMSTPVLAIPAPTPLEAVVAEPPRATPDLTPASTVLAVTTRTPKPTPTEHSRTKRRAKPETKKKAAPDRPIKHILRSLVPPKPTPRPNRR